jgi:hypothetical protein
LRACRCDDDVHDAEDDACGEHDELDGHARQYTFSRVYIADGSFLTESSNSSRVDVRFDPESDQKRATSQYVAMGQEQRCHHLVTTWP